MNRSRILLGILAVLLTVRFGIVPWLEWQSGRRVALEVSQNRLLKSEALDADADEITASLASFRERMQGISQRVPREPSSDAIKLRVQQEISQLAAEHGVKISLFEWLAEGEAGSPSLAMVRARMQLAGSGASVALFHSQLEARNGNLIVRQFQHSFGNPTQTPGNTSVATVIVADVLYLQ